MLGSLQLVLLLFLLKHDGDITLAHQTLLGRVPKPFVMHASNISTASPLIQAHNSSFAVSSTFGINNSSHGAINVTTALPAPFYAGCSEKLMGNYQDIRSGFCGIGDDFCSFKESNGTIIEAAATNFSDQCLLWDPSCTGNKTLAIQKFFDMAFANANRDGESSGNGILIDNDCFLQNGKVNQSDCDRYNPPERSSDLAKIKDWMRSQQCVAAADEWMAMTGNSWQEVFSGGVDLVNIGLIQQAQWADDDPQTNSPSCCGTCTVWGQNVDLYYWIETDANLSCLSIIEKSSNLPLDYGATTTLGWDGTEIYWGCTTSTGVTGVSNGVAMLVPSTYIVTTAEISMMGSLSVKVSSFSPWSSSPCPEDGAGSQSSNQSTKIFDKRASIYAREHSLFVPSSITQADGLPISTVVSGNFTFTSPSVYGYFHGLTFYDNCGERVISPTMLSFSKGELSTIEGHLGSLVSDDPFITTQSTAQFDLRDLPCPPQSIMEANWYKPQPGQPYRPLIAMPNKFKELYPWLSSCDDGFFTAFDPPSALTAAAAVAPPVPPSNAKARPGVPVPSLTLDPGAKQTHGSEASIPVPAGIPTLDQPKATSSAAPAPPKEGTDLGPQLNDPTTQENSPSQPRPNAVRPNSDPNGDNDPQGGNLPKQASDPNQASDPKQGNDPTQGSGSDIGAGAKPNGDAKQGDSNQGSDQNADAALKNDPNQNNGAYPFNAFTDGQVKTINNQVVQPLSHGISIAGTTLTPGAPPITVSGTPIHFGSSALIIGTSTVPLSSGAPNPITTTIAGHVITAAPGTIAVSGNTLTPGAPPVTVSGTPLQLGSSALIVGTSTVPLAPESPMITTIAGQAITAAPNSVAIAGNTLSPGAPGTTIDGTVLSLDALGRFVVGSKTIPLGSTVPETITSNIAGQVITAAPNGIAVAGTTLKPGGPGTTLDGTLLSLDTASHLIVGSKTIPLSSASPNPITTTIGGQVITAAPNGLAIAGTTLAPGASGVTVGGTLVSFNTAGQLIVGSKTMTLPTSGDTGLGGLIMGGVGGVSSEVGDPITTTIDGKVITAEPTALVMAGTTLTPGAPGFTIDGTVVSLNTAAQLVVGSKTIPLEKSAGSSGETAGLGGLIMGAFGSGGPFGPLNTNSPTQGNSSSGAINGTSTSVKAFEGHAVSLKGQFSWKMMAASVTAMSVLAYMC